MNVADNIISARLCHYHYLFAPFRLKGITKLEDSDRTSIKFIMSISHCIRQSVVLLTRMTVEKSSTGHMDKGNFTTVPQYVTLRALLDMQPTVKYVTQSTTGSVFNLIRKSQT